MEMVMPMNYVEMTDEEMMYVDGGGYIGVSINISAAFKRKWNNAWHIAAQAGVAVTTFLSSKVHAAFSSIIGVIGSQIVNYLTQNVRLDGGSTSLSVGTEFFGPGYFVWNINL